MAEVTVPGFLVNFRGALAARPALAGPPPVPVYIVDRRSFADAEAIVLSRVVMGGATWLGWGSGRGSDATVDPLTLQGYAFARVPGSTPADDRVALERVGLLLGEVIGQLRDDPTIGGDLSSTTRYRAPLVDQAVWGAWPGDEQGTAIIRVRCDFRIAWAAITT